MIRTHYFFSKDNIPEKPKPIERDYRGVKFDVGNFVAYNKSGSVRLGKILNINKNEFVLKNNWRQEKSYSEEDMKQFGLYLGDNFKKLKGKTIDEIFEQFKKK